MENGHTPFHALVLPFPHHGHVTPLLRFCERLLLHSHHVKLTFLNTQHIQRRLLSHSPPLSLTTNPNIRFLSIPYALPPPYDSPDASLHPLHIITQAFEQQKGLLEDIIVNSRSTPSPISCIISDHFFHWSQDLADEMHIKRVIFWTSNASFLYADQLMVAAESERSIVERAVSGIGLEGCGDTDHAVACKQIISDFIATRSILGRGKEYIKRNYEKVEKATCIVLGSLQRLEASILKSSMPLRIPVRCVTPFLSLPQEDSNGQEGRAECLRWLDAQPQPSSVLYVSFGTVVKVPSEELHEIAHGIEDSGVPFLWVVRSDVMSDTKSKEMMEALAASTQERGMIIEWAPQLLVLKHPAVGGFLTHCGWNSTLESIASGVPMLCWPTFADQTINSMYIEKIWKVGMRFSKGEKDAVEKEEVKRVVLTLLKGEEGKELRHTATELARDVRKALIEEHGELEVPP